MSEHIDNSKYRKTKLKELILKLHEGGSQEEVRQELLVSLSNIPYGEVIEVEQELIEEGLPEEEVLKLCDATRQCCKVRWIYRPQNPFRMDTLLTRCWKKTKH